MRSDGTTHEEKFTLWQRVAIYAVRVIVLGGISALGLTMAYWLAKLAIIGDCKW